MNANANANAEAEADADAKALLNQSRSVPGGVSSGSCAHGGIS